jgi:MFS family permease
MPYGSFNGVAAVALPFLLRHDGISVPRIAAIEAFVQAPAIWYVLWAPMVDFALRRRTWILLLGVLSGLSTAVALSLSVHPGWRVATGLLVAASAFNQPVSSALGALVAAVVPDAQRGRAAGWSQAGILAAGVVAGGIAIWTSDRVARPTLGFIMGLLIAGPALVALLVPEPPSARERVRAQLARMRRELAATFKRRDAWLGIAFFLSPVSAGALMNLVAGIAPDFRATPSDVVGVAALGGVMMSAGALLGGFVLDRTSRWKIYPLAGLLSAASSGAMLLAPLRPITYFLGAAAYAFSTGIGYAAFMALALQLLGSETAASGTRFTLFTAAVNVPVVYMLRLDGFGHARFGVRGMVAADGLANLVFAVVLFVLLALLARSASHADRATERTRRKTIVTDYAD